MKDHVKELRGDIQLFERKPKVYEPENVDDFLRPLVACRQVFMDMDGFFPNQLKWHCSTMVIMLPLQEVDEPLEFPDECEPF